MSNDYYLFIDESGHHGLRNINDEYPIFALCGVLIAKINYEEKIVPNLIKLKQKYFSSKDIILHSRDIRRQEKCFSNLRDIELRQSFYSDLDNYIESADITIICAVINKKKLLEQYGPMANNPYNLSLNFILERSLFFAKAHNANPIEVICESRGKREDSDLHQQYQLTIDNGTEYIPADRFQKILKSIDFQKKQANVVGTQISDLVAYPIASKILYPDRENLSFKLIETKLYRQFPDGDYLGYGLKIFP